MNSQSLLNLATSCRNPIIPKATVAFWVTTERLSLSYPPKLPDAVRRLPWASESLHRIGMFDTGVNNVWIYASSRIAQPGRLLEQPNRLLADLGTDTSDFPLVGVHFRDKRWFAIVYQVCIERRVPNIYAVSWQNESLAKTVDTSRPYAISVDNFFGVSATILEFLATECGRETQKSFKWSQKLIQSILRGWAQTNTPAGTFRQIADKLGELRGCNPPSHDTVKNAIDNLTELSEWYRLHKSYSAIAKQSNKPAFAGPALTDSEFEEGLAGIRKRVGENNWPNVVKQLRENPENTKQIVALYADNNEYD